MIKVKELDWNENEASSPVGHYRCQRLGDKWEPLRNGYFMLTKWHGIVKAFDTIEEAKAAAQSDYERRILSALSVPVPVPAQEAEGNAAAQIERLAVLRNLGGNHGGEGEDAPDQSSVDAAIAFIRRWGLPDKAITTLSDRGYAAIELHGENYADITFVPAHSGEREALERRIRSAGLKARDEVVDGIRGDGSPDNDLADYLERIVDACVCAALEGKQP